MSDGVRPRNFLSAAMQGKAERKKMARGKKKVLTDADIAKMREVDTYEHADKKRANIPPVGMAQYDKDAGTSRTYSFDPHLDPELQWAGKVEGTSFTVPTSSIHVHESIKPHKIIRSVQAIGDDYEPAQMELFESPVDRMRRRRDAIEFYKHGVNWTNRLIAGDSLVVMNSMLEKEGMAGQVQMMYFDPPYGIKYGSNFQPFVGKRDVKDRDEDLSQEPEMVKAFRDTWELGIHSYLTYIRNRLLVARELLADSGSVFVQISDENVHHIREVCDEVFGPQNFCRIINVAKTSGMGATLLPTTHDYIVWYAKDIKQLKFRQLYLPKGKNDAQAQLFSHEDDKGIFRMSDLTGQNNNVESCLFEYEFEGKKYKLPASRQWKTNRLGLDRLKAAERIISTGSNIYYKRYYNDFAYKALTTEWNDTASGGFTEKKIYVVQTNLKILQRCVLMTTDPGDLILDITCGSGTTAMIAEQWGRRWITCDTSRVAIALAKQRLLTATFDYYQLAHPEQGVASGFTYKHVPHITLRSITKNEPPEQETLYDQPEVEPRKVRITGPFTVEALPAPVVRPLEAPENIDVDLGKKQDDWCEQLRATGVMGRGGNRLMFSRIEPLEGTKFLQAEGETKEETPRRVVVCFAGLDKPLDSRRVALALQEAEDMRPAPKIILFAAFQFDPEAAKDIDETNWPGVQLLKAQMNSDLLTGDLKKKLSGDQSFWLVGQPDVELVRQKKQGTYSVRVNGFDYYDVVKGTVETGSASRIAMWMLDTDYDGMCVEPCQVFFPMGGKKDGWAKLAKTLHAEIDQEKIEAYAGNESLPFTVKDGGMVAVKIIDDRGIESLKVIKIGADE